MALSCLLLSCAPVPDQPQAPAGRRSADDGKPTAEHDVDASVSPTAWRWVSRDDDQEFPAVRDVAGPAGERFTFVVDEAEHTQIRRVAADGTIRWRRDLPDEPMPAGFVLRHGDLLVVAHHSHIKSGCRVHALDADTGAHRWDRELTGLGPVSHSKYRNRVQIHGLVDAIAIAGWESQGRYVEVLDPATGAVRTHALVDDAVATIPWTWAAPPRTELPANMDADGEVLVRMQHHGRLYEARYDAVASGATLAARDSDGTTLWSTDLEGIGLVAHSEYVNDVELGIVSGLVVAYGNEMMGRYIEARDPSTGALVSSQTFLPAPRR